ncbi:Mis12 protein-domain-containing protein [Hypoxylon rubiginosum]|uniref:Mis12 protein-domain-containing protein n=1 Tax=Hypoxylon rubiginosum TaxID=110542 RepID=A0ACC0DFQ2_9PEZI|nr:Mis12 protein-domain-containing protein [Hypoxylon rubiginosum]
MTTTTSDTELLTEHFGYPPVSLIDDIINSVNILAERALNSVEQGLLNAPPATLGFKPPKASRRGVNNNSGDGGEQKEPAELAKMEIESGTHQLETLLCASIDRNFDKFEIYVLRNILCVRPADVRNWMKLSHYEGLDFSNSSAVTSGSSNAPSLDSINHLRRKLRESMRLNALLTAERARNDRMLDELRDLVGVPSDSHVKIEKTSPSNTQSQSDPQQQEQQQQQQKKKSLFAFLHDKGSLTAGGSEAPLSTTTAFTLSQMQALRALSTSLRNLTPDLGPAESSSSPMDVDTNNDGNGSSRDRKTWRRERLEYVEGATRRYLETVEGLELGAHGEVRDGEWQGAGRNLGTGELESTERSFTILGRGAGENTTATASGAAAASRAGASSSRDDDDRMDES